MVELKAEKSALSGKAEILLKLIFECKLDFPMQDKIQAGLNDIVFFKN